MVQHVCDKERRGIGRECEASGAAEGRAGSDGICRTRGAAAREGRHEARRRYGANAVVAAVGDEERAGGAQREAARAAETRCRARAVGKARRSHTGAREQRRGSRGRGGARGERADDYHGVSAAVSDKGGSADAHHNRRRGHDDRGRR